MTKRLVYTMNYDAPVDAVAAMLADPAFREEVCKAQGCIRQTVTIEQKGDGMDVTIDAVQETKGVPSVAKKVVGDETNIVQTEAWSSKTSADVKVTIPGKPGDMTGTASLEDKGATTVETVDLTIKVNIPLVGGKLEGIVSDLLESALRAEEKVGKAYLAR